MDAAEYAIQVIASDSNWNTTAQSGSAFSKFDFDGGVLSSSVIDVDTGEIPTTSTTSYRVQLTSEYDFDKQVVQFDIFSNSFNYKEHLVGLSTVQYWPLNESSGSTVASNEIGMSTAEYLSLQTSGQSANDEGGLVAVFANDADPVEAMWVSNLAQKSGSVSAWIKFTGPERDSVAYPFLGMDYEESGNPTLNMAVYNSAVWVYVNETGSYGIDSATWTTSGTIQQDTWHHVVLNWGRSGIEIYIDGALAESNPLNTEEVASARARNGGEQPLYIGGGYNMFNASTPYTGFLGSVSHVAYIAKALTADEVKELAELKPAPVGNVQIIENSWASVYSD